MPDEKQQELIPEKPADAAAPEKSPAEILYADQGKEKPTVEAKPGEVKAEEKPAEAAKPADGKTVTPETKPGVPEKYDLKLPEGSVLSAAFVEKIAAESKQQGFSNEQAQKYLESSHAAVSAYRDEALVNYQKERDSWVGLVERDPELGGAKFEETKSLAQKAFKAFGTEKLMNDLSETGYGNYPELVRWAARVGKAIAEDRIVTGEKVKAKRSPAEILYGNSMKNH